MYKTIGVLYILFASFFPLWIKYCKFDESNPIKYSFEILEVFLSFKKRTKYIDRKLKEKCHQNINRMLIEKGHQNIYRMLIEKCQQNIDRMLIEKCQQNINRMILEKCQQNIDRMLIEKCQQNIYRVSIEKCQLNIDRVLIEKCHQNVKNVILIFRSLTRELCYQRRLEMDLGPVESGKSQQLKGLYA